MAMAFIDSAATYERDRKLAGETAERYLEIAKRMMAGERVANAPWGDPNFQVFINGTLANCGKWRKDSEDLAVISRVFGGNK